MKVLVTIDSATQIVKEVGPDELADLRSKFSVKLLEGDEPTAVEPEPTAKKAAAKKGH